ncbi:MAG: hypothetical protein ACUVTQ_12265, partial [Desulfotomaculales bacterium]
ADPEEIRRALALLFGPGLWEGFCVELRAPGTRMGTVAGYFAEPEKLAEWAAKLSGGFRNRRGEQVKIESVYVTLNPLNPALLARCANRCQPFAKAAAADADVIARRWLGLDFDPARPAKISSTDAEHQAALDRARRVRDWLRGLGWPEPVLADSGNGGHLLYRVDLPNAPEATELVRRVVDAVAAVHSGEGVDVDRKVYNAARVWKLYGTLATKGDALPDRPHRLARLLEDPDTLKPVPREALERAAALAPGLVAGGTREGEGFDAGAWLEEHGLEIYSAKEWNGGRLWVLRRCPWNPEQHTNLSAFVFQSPDGRLVAKCHHNSCSEKGWHDLRDAVEGPGWRQAAKPPRPARSAEGSGNGVRLPGRVAVPPDWDGKVLVLAGDWESARAAYAAGHAVVVAFQDGRVPAEAGPLLRRAGELRAAADNPEVLKRLEWLLAPLLLIRRGQAEAAAGGAAEGNGGSAPEPDAPEEPKAEATPPQEPVWEGDIEEVVI